MGGAALLLAAAIGQCAHAEDGSAAWLRYAPVKNAAQYRTLPSRIAVTGDTPAEQTAAKELQRGLSSMLGRDFTVLALPRAGRTPGMPS